MSVHFKIEGLDALLADLRKLPAELAGEAGKFVEGRANGAGVAVRTGYAAHRDSGNLQDHVAVEKRAAGRFGVAYVVKSTARHAYVFENGSQARHYITKNGVKKLTGSMPLPPQHVFVPAMERARYQLFDEDLRGLLTRAGLEVRDA